ncbi:MAG: hypothetical protein V9G24_15975 [Rhodoblastus sp.]
MLRSEAARRPEAGQSRNAALAAGRACLRAAGIEAADADARLLLVGACRIESLALVTGGDVPLSQAEAEEYRVFLDRRVAGEPASRILGRRAFWTLDLEVRPGVLDPRGDSEALVRLALRVANANEAPPRRIVDLGCGSGALLCALLSEYRRGVRRSASTCRAEACAATQANLRRNRLGRTGRRPARHAGARRSPAGSISSFPTRPTFPRATSPGSSREVRDHDPPLALDGGADGLDAYRALFAAAGRILAPTAALVVEFGFGQAADVERIARAAALQKIDGERDIGGRERASAFALA